MKRRRRQIQSGWTDLIGKVDLLYISHVHLGMQNPLVGFCAFKCASFSVNGK